MNKYREAMIFKRNHCDTKPVICTTCAGWSSFGGKNSPVYIALHGAICICTPHWIKLEKIVKALEKNDYKVNHPECQ